MRVMAPSAISGSFFTGLLIRSDFAGYLQQSGQSDEAVAWCSSATAP